MATVTRAGSVGCGNTEWMAWPPKPAPHSFPVRMVPERSDQAERLATVVGAEQRGRLRPGVDDAGLIRAARLDLPDPLDAAAQIFGKPDGCALGLGPGGTKIIRPVDARSPVFAGAADEHPRLITSGVDAGAVDALHQQVRFRPLPLLATRIGPTDPQALLGARQHYRLGHHHLRLFVLGFPGSCSAGPDVKSPPRSPAHHPAVSARHSGQASTRTQTAASAGSEPSASAMLLINTSPGGRSIG